MFHVLFVFIPIHSFKEKKSIYAWLCVCVCLDYNKCVCWFVCSLDDDDDDDIEKLFHKHIYTTNITTHKKKTPDI